MFKQWNMRRLLFPSLIMVTIFVLSACGSSDKEQYLDARESTTNADSFEMETSLSLDIKTDDLQGDDREAADLLNSVDLAIDIKSDNEAKQREFDVGVNADIGVMNLDLDVPVFVDEGAEKVYTKTEGFVNVMNVFTMFTGMPMEFPVPDHLDGKVIEVDAEDESGSVDESDLEAVKEVLANIEGVIEDIPEDDFTKEEEVITYEISGDELVNSTLEALEDYDPTIFDVDMDMEEIQAEFKEAINVGDISVESEIEDGNLATESMEIPLVIQVDANEEIDLTLLIENSYNNIGGDIDFSFDLDDDNILTQEEFEMELQDAMGNQLHQ